MRTLALSASRGSRTGELVERLQRAGDVRLLCTQGTYDYLLREGVVQRKNENHIRLRPGVYGGVTQIADTVVRGDCDAVAVLSDPTDHDIESPDHRTLLRLAVQLQTPMLLTLDEVEQWARGHGGVTKARERGSGMIFHGSVRTKRIPNVDKRGGEIVLPINRQTIAVVSHDDKKLDMMKLVSRHGDLLKRFHRVIATGTTGRHVHELTDVPVLAYASGPLGGDVRIAAEILSHTCHQLFFFIDTLSAQPHEADVRMLQRASQIPGVKCRAYFSPDTADAAAEELRAGLVS